MIGQTGRDVNRSLEEMLGAITEYGSETLQHAAADGASGAGAGAGNGGGHMAGHQDIRKRSRFSGSIMASLVSVLALVFSGFSFYETVLKQASLRLYTPPLIHMFRESYRDVLAIPVTISNDGAKRGTVLSFDLRVTNLRTGEAKIFQNLYFGSSPRADRKLFNPITVPGRSSYSGVVLFHALKAGAFVKTTGGVKLPLRLSLSMNLDRTGDWFDRATSQPVTFDMTANYITSFPEMEKGRPTPFHDERWQQSKTKSGG